MLTLKGCLRCGGDLYLETNEFEEDEETCLQCGYRGFNGVTNLDAILITANSPERSITRLAA